MKCIVELAVELGVYVAMGTVERLAVGTIVLDMQDAGNGCFS